MNEAMTCGPDGCEVDIDAMIRAKAEKRSGEDMARRKLSRWLYEIGAYDIDAPNSTVREQGV